MPKLTKRFVDTLHAHSSDRDRVIFDDDLPCFGIRAKRSGAKSWLVQYRNVHGQSRRLTLGRLGVLTPDEARKLARQTLAAVAKGADPASERKAARKAITLSELCDEYLEAGKGRIKESTLLMDRSRIERHVKPLLGSRIVASLTHADMEKFLRDVMAGKSTPKRTPQEKKDHKRPRGGLTRGGPGAGSRTLGMLGTVLERAVRDDILAKNPVRGIARPKDEPKRPPFSIERIKAVGSAMRELQSEGENKVGLRAIRFLLLTGCRRMEGLTLQRRDIDRQARCLRLRDTKTGKQIRPVGRRVIEFLASIIPDKGDDAEYVFPGTSKAGHLVGLPRVWARVTARAEIVDVTLHGLRHWFAAAATEINYSELTIAGLLGHKVKGITARYANAPDAALLAAADCVSMKLSEALDGKVADDTVVRIGAR